MEIQPPTCYNKNMSVFISFAILFLSMLIQAFLQVTPGIFSIFYHSALAKNSRKKADDLSLYYILGVEIFSTIIFITVFSFMSFVFTFQDFINGIFPWLMAGVFSALSVVSFFFYFRKGSGTTLFISRRIAKGIATRTKKLKNRSDALVLGIISSILDLIFTLPLYIIVSIETIKISSFPNFLVIILYIIVSTIPLFTLRTFFRGGLNLADIQRLRIKNKSFFRIIITVGFLLLAFSTIGLGVI